MTAKWTIMKANPEATAKISRITGCHETVAQLLVNRGISTPEQAFTFLNPSFQHLTDPFALKDMKKAVERIYTAICNKEKILIFGDFDADGITATVLLHEFLSYAEAEVSWYIPHRIREGYSLKSAHIEMAVKQKCDLLITVDCGSDSHDAVRAAIKEDIDVIITDHHEITNFRPPALAVVNPKQKDCKSGLDYLAGVGVAFYLVIALRSHLRQKEFWENIPEPNLMEYCDLFAIGTIADMVPLKAENRILSKAGITTIHKGKREGLKALIAVSRLDQNAIDSDDIGFRIAPRINAAGRISHSRICVDLLTEKNRVKAEQTAFILDELNKKRQEMEKRIVDEIEKRISLDPEILKRSSIVMEDSAWNAGVLGIAASRISRKYSRPVVLISTASSFSVPSSSSSVASYPVSSIPTASAKIASIPTASVAGSPKNVVIPATGSCRSIGNINIHEALCACAVLLENFGGHRMAAGISIKPENIKKFADCFEDQISRLATSEDFIPKIIIDAHIHIDEITASFMEEIERLRPFGTDNPEPLFQCSDVKVVSSFMIGSKHRKMVLKQIGQKQEQEILKKQEREIITKQEQEIITKQEQGNGSENCKSIEAMQFNIGEKQEEEQRLVQIQRQMQVQREEEGKDKREGEGEGEKQGTRDEQVMLFTPDYFKKIAIKLKINRFNGKNTPQIIIEHT
ncbi:MAG: single-stranded-DNA-specific exonuclease RecJ [Desulfamplus sp.]|nr:single-stranded-DNA-specific exonuclease RecJ [Desulfamplus sp.]